MKTQIILVDFENVQPGLLPALSLEDVKVFVFVAPQQLKLPIATVEAVQKMGAKAEYIRVSKQGPDALDMHIAFYMGRLSLNAADVFFHVIAKDRDYDPLIAHLRALQIWAAKWPDLSAIPILKLAAAMTPKDKVSAASNWLQVRKGNRPKSLKTLQSSLKKSAFSDRLDENEIDQVIEGLRKQKIVQIDGQKLQYPSFSDD